MKKVMSFLVVSGLCANGSCFGMDWDLAKSKAAAIAKKARKNRTVRKINRKVRKIKKVVKNNRKIQAVLGASTAVAGSALAYRYLEAAKNLTVNVPVSKISGNSVGFLTKALNLTKSSPVATGLTTIGGLAGIAAAMTYFMKSEAIENKVEDHPNNNNSNEKGNPEQPKQEDVKGQPRSEATEDSSNDDNSGGANPVVENPENPEQIEVNNILQNHKNLDKQIVQISNDLRSGKTIDSSVIGSLKKQVESERNEINKKISKLRESNSPEVNSNSKDISDSIKILENKMLLITILTKIYEVTQSFNNDNLDVDAYKKLVDDLKNLRVDALKIYNSKDPENILTLFKDGKSLISSVLDAAESASAAAYDRVDQKTKENPIPIENKINQTIQSYPDENNMYASENNESQKGVNQEASLSNGVPTENWISNGDTTVLIDSDGDTTVLSDSEDENTVSDQQDCTPKINQVIQSYKNEDNMYADPGTSNTNTNSSDYSSLIHAWQSSGEKLIASENNESQKGVNQEASLEPDVLTMVLRYLNLKKEEIPTFIRFNDVPRLKFPIELPKDLINGIPFSMTYDVNTKLLTYDGSSRTSNPENEESRHVATNTNKRKRSQSEPIFGSGNNEESNTMQKSKSVSNLSEISKRARKRQRRKENNKILKDILDVIQKTENLFKDWPTLEKEGKFDQIRKDYNLDKNSDRWKALVQKALEMRYS